MFKHEHPLNLVDLWAEQLQREDEHEEDEEENDELLLANQAFKSLCFLCREEIKWFHRYYYTCSQCSDYLIHKFCAEFPDSLEDVCEVGHTLDATRSSVVRYWSCDVCDRSHDHESEKLHYQCRTCYFNVDTNCVPTILQRNIIHHPSHKHPLICITKPLLAKCDACGKEHKGFFYHCSMCDWSNFVHSDCAFLPQKLQIQQATNDVFSHIHPLTLAYSFSFEDQQSKNWPVCRVCGKNFPNKRIWIYKCEKCRYFTHLVCATSRNEPFMSIFTPPGLGKIVKNYQDDEHPGLLHLPFPDPSYSILKHLFYNKNGSSTLEITYKTQDVIHQHPLILEDATRPTSSRIKPIPYHDQLKRTELLCDGCSRPIMSGPIYVCANEDKHCNFVLHKWCSQLPIELKDHPSHPQHTLVLRPKIPGMFFGVFRCKLCLLWCNGFVYYCEECEYHIDVNCAFSPKEIVHNSHPNHILSRYYHKSGVCSLCRLHYAGQNFIFSCHTCDFHIHAACASLIPETTTHKCDRHPMMLKYTPAENHKSEYFCEVCEAKLDPERPFYYCRECMHSIHPACAPSILRYETAGKFFESFISKYVNVKFGGTYYNIKVHQHPFSFVQGIANDGVCYKCDHKFYSDMIFKCLDCEFAIHYRCCLLDNLDGSRSNRSQVNWLFSYM